VDIETSATKNECATPISNKILGIIYQKYWRLWIKKQYYGGSYMHLGLRTMLIPYLIRQNAQLYIPSCILNIGINIDGLSIAKSSKSQHCPILISILNFKELPNNVIPIGPFHGFQNPKSLEEYLNTFIIDLLEVIDNGLNINETLFTLTISNISCDAILVMWIQLIIQF